MDAKEAIRYIHPGHTRVNIGEDPVVGTETEKTRISIKEARQGWKISRSS